MLFKDAYTKEEVDVILSSLWEMRQSMRNRGHWRDVRNVDTLLWPYYEDEQKRECENGH